MNPELATPEREPVYGLWIGRELSVLELLCIASFQASGHPFHLWVYKDFTGKVPPGTILRDASSIIPESEVFSYTHKNQFGHGKGSFAGFSDIFRYKLLWQEGGWWTDMDITCLRPLPEGEDYVFRTHHEFPVVGNLMHCPPRSPLMEKCLEDARREVHAGNRDWNLPIAILNHHIREFGLLQCARPLTNPDRWPVVRKLLVSGGNIPEDIAAIHWMNEEWRANGISKKAIAPSSVLGKLLSGYGLYRKPAFVPLLTNRWRLSWVRMMIKSAPRFIYFQITGFVKFHGKRFKRK